MKSYKDFVAAANAVITSMPVTEAVKQVGKDDTVFVDLRGDMELSNTGIIPSAVHVSRGMLEFVIDPTSPYHNPIFAADKAFIFYCASGGRSALAVQRAEEMGLKRVVNMSGGLKAWKEAGFTLEPYPSA